MPPAGFEPASRAFSAIFGRAFCEVATNKKVVREAHILDRARLQGRNLFCEKGWSKTFPGNGFPRKESTKKRFSKCF